MSEDLKPCPFCGDKKPHTEHVNLGHWWYVFCRQCWAQGPRKHVEKEVVKGWNVRKRKPFR